MKKRRTTSIRAGMIFPPMVLFLFFIAAFASLFYFLYTESSSFEHERAQRDLRILTSAIQTTLLADEKFFLANLPRASNGGMNLHHECQQYTATHPEIASVGLRRNNVLQWNFIADSSADIFLWETVPTNPPKYDADSSTTVLYSKPFQLNNDYYFEARFSSPENETPSATFSVFYSAEKLLRDVLHRHPMENYEITLFSGTGKGIASTGYSNAESPLRLQSAVPGYHTILSVEIANPNYSFWTAEMIVGAVMCGLLSLAVFMITFVLLRANVKLKSAESSLRSSEERFRTIFENSADAMRLMDRYGRIVMVNSAYCDLVKTSREELLREYSAGDTNLEERYSANSAFRGQFDAGTLKMPSSQVIKRHEEEDVPVEASHSFIDVGKGEKLLLSIFRDVSERKKFEKDSQQVQKMDALGEFAVGIGNNLKNIVGIVMNSAEMVNKEAGGNSQLRLYADMITRESKRASELADDLLVFARSKTAELKPILLEKVIHQAGKILEHSLPPSIAVSISLNDNHAIVNGDIHQLHQAIVNLAITAQQRLPGSGTIRIETVVADPKLIKGRSPFSKGKEFVAVMVSDNGRELDEYSKRRIFEPFFNAHPTDQSAGLRLSVTYGIVQQHGGFVDVRSEHGKGTTISLFFPVVSYEESKGTRESTKPPQGGGECLLIVDDEESFRQIYESGLTSLGYTVYAAQDGEEALAVYQQHQSEIDLVVSDLMMPKMNGEELFQKLFAHNPSVKGILVTGAIDLKAKTEFLTMGIRDIITKPFLFDELLTVVRKVLDGQ